MRKVPGTCSCLVPAPGVVSELLAHTVMGTTDWSPIGKECEVEKQKMRELIFVSRNS